MTYLILSDNLAIGRGDTRQEAFFNAMHFTDTSISFTETPESIDVFFNNRLWLNKQIKICGYIKDCWTKEAITKDIFKDKTLYSKILKSNGWTLVKVEKC